MQGYYIRYTTYDIRSRFLDIHDKKIKYASHSKGLGLVGELDVIDTGELNDTRFIIVVIIEPVAAFTGEPGNQTTASTVARRGKRSVT